MPPYEDSDSSAGEDVEYTETNVLLGYASKDADEDTISRLGGRPEWLDPSTPPSAAFARCKICKDLTVLLLQLNGELPEKFPGHERRLYVFSCRKKSCRRRDGSTRVIRGVRIDPKVKTLAPRESQKQVATTSKGELKSQTYLGETLFGTKGLGTSSSSANPFSTSASPLGNPFAAPTNPFSSPVEAKPEPEANVSEAGNNTIQGLQKTFAETLSLNNDQEASTPPLPPEPWPAEKDLPTPYPVSYLADADYEVLDPTPPSVSQATTRMDVDEPASSSGGKEDREVFESSMDTDFQKFADRLAQNPEQVIRYEFGGQPLLYSKNDAVGQALGSGRGMPRCSNCGSGRVFEVQMAPNAITELEAEELSLEGMDWGTIIIGVCASDCQPRNTSEGQAGYLEEWVGVQWEDLTASR